MHHAAKRFNAQLRRSRMALFVMLLPLAATSDLLLGFVQPALRLIYIVLGFSLIIFLHELGHFVVARLCSVKCLAFSIGIGPRMCGWRKNGRLTFGPDPYDGAANKDKPSTSKEKTLGEREDEKYALKSLDEPNSATVYTEKGPVAIQPDTPNLTGDILGKPAAAPQSDLPTTAKMPIHNAALGDCDYRISWLPLGGYVRMLGQDDLDPTKISDDPHSFNRRPIWQRMCIVSAGVIMNLIFAAVCFSIIFSPGIGVGFPPAVVGQVVHGTPAWDSGKLQMGDQIISIDNQKPRGFLEFTDLQMAAALSDGSTPVHLLVKPADGGTPFDLALTPKRDDELGNGLLAFGLEPMVGVKIADQGSDYTDPKYAAAAKSQDLTFAANEAQYAKIRKGDRIAAINGVPLPEAKDDRYNPDERYPYLTLVQQLNDANGKPVKLTLANSNPKLPNQDITIVPRLVPISGADGYPQVLGLSPTVTVGKPQSGSPALGKLREGDLVVRVGDCTFPTQPQMIAAIQASPGKPITVVVERAVAPRTGTAESPSTQASTQPGMEPEMQSSPAETVYVSERYSITPRDTQGKGFLGVPIYPTLAATRFIPPPADSPVGALSLSPMATIASIDGQPVHNWQDIYEVLRTVDPGKSVKVTFNNDGQQVATTLSLSDADSAAVRKLLMYHLGLHLENETRDQVARNAGDAVLMGLDHTKKFILNVYMTLAGLFRGTVPADNLHGIVGITKVGYDVQERGPVWLWYVLALVSVNLAVANFLPLPIVDGGLFLLLILEKIRGKPLSLKVQTAIQTVGIVLLAGLFLFVTYNDITGMFLK